MVLEGAELITPLGLELVQECLHGDQRVWFEAEDPHPSVVGDPFVSDDPRAEEDLQVAAEGRRRHARGLSQLPGPMWAAAEQLDYPSSGGIGKSFKHIHGGVNY